MDQSNVSPIRQFEGDYSFLSNFFLAQFYDDWLVSWPTVEHYFQAMKTTNKNEQEKIRNTGKPGGAKRLGKNVPLRNDWEPMKQDVMRKALYYKFTQHENLQKDLITTYPQYLEEGNWWHDNYWGNCYCPRCRSKPGLNILGDLLMELRMYLTVLNRAPKPFLPEYAVPQRD